MAVEEALVKCLEMCADFNYPMGKKKLQNLVQSYCVENNVDTRWKGHRPGKDWVRLFKKEVEPQGQGLEADQHQEKPGKGVKNLQII